MAAVLNNMITQLQVGVSTILQSWIVVKRHSKALKFFSLFYLSGKRTPKPSNAKLRL